MKGTRNFLFLILLLINFNVNAQWVQQVSGTSSQLWSIEFLTTNIGFIAGHDGTILKTLNGGVNWNKLSGVGVQPPVITDNLKSVFFINLDTGFVVGYSTNVYKTINGGLTWSIINLPITVKKDCRAVFFINDSLGFIAANGCTVFKTTDGGNSWVMNSSILGLNIQLLDIFFINSNIGYAVGDDATILKTIDGGISWLSQNNPLTGYSKFYSSVQFININIGYVVGQDGTILKTINGGNNWTSLQNPSTGTTIPYYGLYFTSLDTGYVGQYFTTDGGVNWTSPYGSCSLIRDLYFLKTGLGYALGTYNLICKLNQDSTISIKKVRESNLINVFPNPTNNRIVIENLLGKNEMISIYTIYGVPLFKENILSTKVEIDVRNFEKGVYFLKYENGQSSFVNIIVKD